MIDFKTEKISNRVTRIFGICSELMYLVEGDEKAALIDTGSGFGSLRQAVERLTDKQIIVLITHGHVDHAMGAGEFENVYMSYKDKYIYEPHGDMQFRWDGLNVFEGNCRVAEEDYVPTLLFSNFKDLKGGDSFDLGNLTIEIYDCAGHTRGSVVMLINEERLLLLGDACNNGTFMFEDYSLSIKEYEKNLILLKKETEGKYNRVLSSHGDGNLPLEIMDGVIKVCEDIQMGHVDDVAFAFKDVYGYKAKATIGSFGPRLDGGIGNIIYNKNNIYYGGKTDVGNKRYG